jgi:predicted TIM-barrel fold metal-dependent hydrolase
VLEDLVIVDAHHHFLPAGVLAHLRELAGGQPRLVNDRISVTLNPDLASTAAQLAAMDGSGVDVAILTNSGVSVLGNGVCRLLNAGLAAVQSEFPGRFVAASHIDIEDPDCAAELERCVSDFGSRVLALPCSAPTRQLDDPSLDELWRTVTMLQMPVILHPAQLPRGASLDYGLERSCARPFDTTQAAVRLMSGVLPRFPQLRFVLPHCGGTAPFLKGRLAMFFNTPGEPSNRQLPRTQREQQAEGLDRTFEELWSKLYFDTAGTGGWSPIVNYTAALVGADHLLFGTDFPLESHSADTMRELVEMLANLDGDDAARRAIASGTASQLFGDVVTQALAAR